MLHIRPIQKGDLDILTQIVRDVWEMDSLCGSEEAGRYLSNEYLIKTLNHSTSAQVAVMDGQIAGLVAIREGEKLPPFSFEREKAPAGLGQKEIQTMRDHMTEYDRSCQKLLQDSGYEFEGEITLLAVSPSSQGYGIGVKLFEKAKEQFGHRRFFLYTDTSCHYQFYDHRGMKCLAKKQKENPYRKKAAFLLFLYGSQ